MALLEGKTAVITGASKGIGLAIAIEFAKEGAQILLNHRKTRNENLAKEKETINSIYQFTGKSPIVCEADLTVEDDVIRLA